MRVLIVEDEERVSSFISRGLKEAGYVSDIAENGEIAQYLASVNDYDIMLVDWMMPGMSGVELCEILRKQGNYTPILMVTAKDHTNDVVKALDAGADGYIVKPFSFSELLARIRAQLRRASTQVNSVVRICENLTIDMSKRVVMNEDMEIPLSAKEFSLLEYLVRNRGTVVTKSEIAEHVWGILFDTNTNVIEVYINHLRQKLNCGQKKGIIQTIRGVGYKLREIPS